MYIRHGDVIIKQINKIPKGIKLKKKKEAILAEGEITGHFHRLESPELLYGKEQETQYIEIKKPAKLSHEEHNTIVIPEGKYQVLIQREVDLLNETRQVMD